MRTRHQEGWVEERGSRHKRWYGHYYIYVTDESGKETRRHIGVQLGEKNETSEVGGGRQTPQDHRQCNEGAAKAKQPHTGLVHT